VAESDLLDALVSGRATPQDPISGHMSPPLPVLGQGEPVSSAAAVLEKSGAALVHVDGKPAAVLTRADLLAYYATASGTTTSGTTTSGTTTSGTAASAVTTGGEEQ
jgi:cystathionine beta-synthase